jgi:hypothetical protein
VLIDHLAEHPSELGGRDSVVGFLRGLLEPVPGARAAIHFLNVRDNIAVSRVHLYTDDADTLIGIVITLRNGAIDRIELFAAADEARLRARGEELRAATHTAPRRHRCSGQDESPNRATGGDAH